MTIKVFISRPRGPYAENHLLGLAARLRSLVDGIDITVKGKCPLTTETDYDCLAKNISAIRNCDLVVLANGWDNDKRCRLEKELATWL